MNDINKRLQDEKNKISERLEEKRESVRAMRERIKKRNKRTVQIISLIAVLLVLAVATVASIPLVKAFGSQDGLDALQEQLASYKGIWGAVVFVLIQALQVVIAVIPPIQIVGGLLFGWFIGGILSFGGTVLGTLCIFILVKRFGRPLVEAFVNEKHLTKYKFLQDERKLTIILMILYLIPGIPKDVISYIVPLTKIKRRDFFMYVMPCRLPSIMMSTVLGSNVGDGNLRVAIGIVIAAAVIGIVGFIFKEPLLAKLGRRKKSS